MGRPDGNRLDGPTMSPVDQLEISGRWTSLVSSVCILTAINFL